MKIICLTRFLDGTDIFEKDDQRTVSDERGAYFCANGWAVDAGGGTPVDVVSGDIQLSVNSASSGTGDSNG